MTPPLVRRVDAAPRPEELFRTVADHPWALWLDSALRVPGSGEQSFVAVDPFLVLRSRSGRTEWISREGPRPASADAFAELAAALEACRPTSSGDTAPTCPPFCGGAGGYIGYEAARLLERLPPPRADDLRAPDLELAFYDVVVGWDHPSDACWIASTGHLGPGRTSAERAQKRLDSALGWLAGGRPPRAGVPAAKREGGGAGHGAEAPETEAREVPAQPVQGATGFVSSLSRDGYEAAVHRAIELIRAGDVFQVNLSQRFETAPVSDALDLYQRLRRANPAPFGAFFRGSGCALASASPERFLHLGPDGRAQSRPIKGTRPRGTTPEEDARLAAELLRSRKDRAENLMIVDLLRNDLSRVCRPGTVAATERFHLESFATVHHLVSTIEGTLRPGLGAVDLVRAAFPCGSVTGAPKIRAMEIIAEREPVARGPYCGAIGYLGFGGDADLSVAIRTLVLHRQRATFHAGGAVVADSDPAAEYEESLAKARALIDACEATR